MNTAEELETETERAIQYFNTRFGLDCSSSENGIYLISRTPHFETSKPHTHCLHGVTVGYQVAVLDQSVTIPHKEASLSSFQRHSSCMAPMVESKEGLPLEAWYIIIVLMCVQHHQQRTYIPSVLTPVLSSIVF